MSGQGTQLGYAVRPEDNVATAVTAIAPGAVCLTGARVGQTVCAVAAIGRGHKIALRAIALGEPVVKYGATIGVATKAIAPGEHVHLHNMKSCFDKRSASLNADTAMSVDVEYNLY